MKQSLAAVKNKRFILQKVADTFEIPKSNLYEHLKYGFQTKGLQSLAKLPKWSTYSEKVRKSDVKKGF